MAAAAGALQQARHALGRADLQHAVDRQEVHAQIEAAGGHHRLQRAGLQARLDPVAHRLVERAVMQRDQPGPRRFGVEDRLVPDLRLRARVGEHQRGAAGGDLAHHRFEHLQAQVPAPGEAARRLRQQRVDDDRLVDPAVHQHARIVRQQRAHRLHAVAQRGAQAPDRRRGARQPPHPRQRQLHLHAALAADQFVPFVDHHQLHAGQQLRRIGARQQQRQALGRGDQCLRQLPALARALGAVGVTGAHADRPVQPQIGQRRFQRARGVGRQRAHRRDPQQPQAAAGHLAGQRAIEQREPQRIGLAGAGRRMQQPRAAGCHLRPDFALKRKRCKAACSKPALGAGQRKLPLAALGGAAHFLVGFLRRSRRARHRYAASPQLGADVGPRR